MMRQIMKPVNLIRATVAYQTVKAKDTAKNAYAKKRKQKKQKIQNTLEKTVVEDQVKELRSHMPMDHMFLLQR